MGRTWGTQYAVAFVAFVCLVLSGCYEARAPLAGTASTECEGCHGSADNLAPPAGVWLEGGKTSTSDRGVGAHQIHLNATLSTPLTCGDCHTVPETIYDDGHMDSALPAEVIFSALAKANSTETNWDGATCTVYCHQGDGYQGKFSKPKWTLVDGSQKECDSCHGAPPAVPHPQSAQCAQCHTKIVDKDGKIIAPELHINGQVEIPGQLGCNGCHGSDLNAAPPNDTAGQSAISERGVGVHQSHVVDTLLHKAYDCSMCHIKPDSWTSEGHIDALPAEVVFGDLAKGDLRDPKANLNATWNTETLSCSDVYCHSLNGAGALNPPWTAKQTMVCGSCHGLPPQKTMKGDTHPSSSLSGCTTCHPDTINAVGEIIDISKHANGIIEVAGNLACNACHGNSSNAAPPTDTSGSSDINSRGVGVHQSHVKATALHAAFDCDVCHVKPTKLTDPGHIDSDLPAEVIFGDLAKGNLRSPQANMSPVYDASSQTCSSVYCHTLEDGGLPVQNWVVPTTLVCGSCHGLPPSKTLGGTTHPSSSLAGCTACHGSTVNSAGEIIDVSKHLNGKVDF